MGVLDEAIRAHLELKRRSGADEREVSRIEAEALGPVRRDGAGRASVGDEGDAPAEESVATWHADPTPGDDGEPEDDPTVPLGGGDETLEPETQVLEPDAGGLRRRFRLRRAQPEPKPALEPPPEPEHNGAGPETDLDDGPRSDPRSGRDPDFDD